MERALAASLADQAEELGRVRQLVADQRARLAHLMHGGLQAELTASALTLSREWGNSEQQQAPERVVAELLAEIDRQQVAMDSVQPALDLEEVIDTWRLAMDLVVDCGAEVTDRLFEDAELGARVTDVLSEALTNVVRHGDERRARVVLVGDGDRTIQLTVRNRGNLSENPSGLGSEEMDERCVQWSRAQDGPDVVLMAWLASSETLHQPVASSGDRR